MPRRLTHLDAAVARYWRLRPLRSRSLLGILWRALLFAARARLAQTFLSLAVVWVLDTQTATTTKNIACNQCGSEMQTDVLVGVTDCAIP